MSERGVAMAICLDFSKALNVVYACVQVGMLDGWTDVEKICLDSESSS